MHPRPSARATLLALVPLVAACGGGRADYGGGGALANTDSRKATLTSADDDVSVLGGKRGDAYTVSLAARTGVTISMRPVVDNALMETNGLDPVLEISRDGARVMYTDSCESSTGGTTADCFGPNGARGIGGSPACLRFTPTEAGVFTILAGDYHGAPRMDQEAANTSLVFHYEIRVQLGVDPAMINCFPD